MTVLLLHAFPLDERMWEPQLAASRGHDVVAPRLYGRGSSIDGWAEQLLREVDGELDAVGVSMGGYTALALARRAPERVRSLVLVSTRPDADSAARRRYRGELIARLRAGLPIPNEAEGVSTAELVAATEALRDRPDSSDVLAGFDGPVVVCVGDHDDLFSVDEARRAAELAPHGRLEVFEGAGHLLTLERPERFNVLLEEVVLPWR